MLGSSAGEVAGCIAWQALCASRRYEGEPRLHYISTAAAKWMIVLMLRVVFVMAKLIVCDDECFVDYVVDAGDGDYGNGNDDTGNDEVD